ncbi:MAG: hypothetical protein KGJ93_02895 [Patescibacteria group bacterium]|nr:hypothetical protein [Patescibacteria group bacterium]
MLRLFFAVCLMVATAFGQQGHLPELATLPSSTYVVDEGQMLPQSRDAALNSELRFFHLMTGVKLAVVQLPELPPNPDPNHDRHHPVMDPNEAADRLGRRWGLGRYGDPHSVVLVLAAIPRLPKSFTMIGISRGADTQRYLTPKWLTDFLLYQAFPAFNKGLLSPPPNSFWGEGVETTASGISLRIARHTTRPKVLCLVAAVLFFTPLAIWLIGVLRDRKHAN